MLFLLIKVGHGRPIHLWLNLSLHLPHGILGYVLEPALIDITLLNYLVDQCELERPILPDFFPVQCRQIPILSLRD